MQTDVLVVGGGPAGSTLARRLALAGREVTLIERAAFPRHKPCGGGLSRHTIDALELDFSPVLEADVGNLVVDGAWSGRFSMPVARSCQVVSRWDFDAFLAKAAASAGARVLERHGLRNIVRDRAGFQVSTSGGDIRARVVCACDGAFSATGKALGFPRNRDLSVALEALAVLKADSDPAIRERAVFDFTALPMGYSWIFPRQSELNIGVCTARHGPGSGLRQTLDRFVRHSRELHDLEIRAVKGGQLPTFHRPRASYAEGNAYLVGDAAGFVDLFTGEGLQYAVKSARLAAEAILGDGPVQYQAALAREILPELELAARWANLVFRIPPRLFGAIMSTPLYRYYLRYFLEIFAGARTYSGMLAEIRWTARMLGWDRDFQA